MFLRLGVEHPRRFVDFVVVESLHDGGMIERTVIDAIANEDPDVLTDGSRSCTARTFVEEIGLARRRHARIDDGKIATWQESSQIVDPDDDRRQIVIGRRIDSRFERIFELRYRRKSRARVVLRASNERFAHRRRNARNARDKRLDWAIGEIGNRHTAEQFSHEHGQRIDIGLRRWLASRPNFGATKGEFKYRVLTSLAKQCSAIHAQRKFATRIRP